LDLYPGNDAPTTSTPSSVKSPISADDNTEYGRHGDPFEFEVTVRASQAIDRKVFPQSAIRTFHASYRNKQCSR
ncbi:hypothetical protein, partial [Mycobacteroides abscessus]|uniref:hypothetical protein n=1 Tax=Mycobacteroides abscessus TaxID=36809 RepID=UPI001C26A4AC